MWQAGFRKGIEIVAYPMVLMSYNVDTVGQKCEDHVCDI